eukprot:jgi/Astpho2/413/e_gw1.00011.181.1_t
MSSYARSRGCCDWLIYGQADWERISAQLRAYGPGIAGALFGAGWWCWADAVVYTSSTSHERIPATFWLPAVAATLALIFINLISRDDLHNIQDRARMWLLFSYVVAFGSVAGAVTVLIVSVQNHHALWVGAASLLQCGLILIAALLFWAYRTADDSGYVGY